MVHLNQKISTSRWEIPFQLVLHIVVFLFYSVDADGMREGIRIDHFEYAFFLNYAITAAIINYVLFPRLLYQNKYGWFLAAIVVLITGTILVEELFLEKLYFTGKRSENFGKAVYNLIDVLPVTIILSGFKLAWDIIRKQMLVEELKATVEESELKFLKSQINPHFLFNNLNNLYAHALENSPRTPQIILEMSSVLRYMLYECNQEYVSLKNELMQLENFIKLYEMQIEGRGEVNYQTHGHADESNQLIAPLILMVFVENAFKHSAIQQTENIQIQIDVTLHNEQLEFRCTNSYCKENEAQDEHGGIGLQNVKKRLQYSYPGAHVLHIIPSDSQYLVELKINLSYHK